MLSSCTFVSHLKLNCKINENTSNKHQSPGNEQKNYKCNLINIYTQTESVKCENSFKIEKKSSTTSQAELILLNSIGSNFTELITDLNKRLKKKYRYILRRT